MKTEILDQCAKLIDTKLNNVLETQQDQGQLLLQYKNDQQRDHKTVVDIIRELTISIKSLSAMMNIEKNPSPTDTMIEENGKEPSMVTPMQTEKEQNKRKDNYIQVSHRKTRSKVTLE